MIPDKFKVGDRCVLAHPRLQPKYLNGAIIKLTFKGPTVWAGQFCETPYASFDASIVAMQTPRQNGRYRVGTMLIGVSEQLLHPVPEEVAA